LTTSRQFEARASKLDAVQQAMRVALPQGFEPLPHGYEPWIASMPPKPGSNPYLHLIRFCGVAIGRVTGATHVA
jgi:hypothetical protein